MNRPILAVATAAALSASTLVAHAATNDEIADLVSVAEDYSPSAGDSTVADGVEPLSPNFGGDENEVGGDEIGGAEPGGAEIDGDEPGSSEVGSAEPSSAEIEGSEESDDTLTGVTVVLALLGVIGGGAYLAVTNGLVALPDAIAQAGYDMGVPEVTPNQGSCDSAEFDAVVDGWPAPLGTSVSYCDGLFATAGANGTDWVVHFNWQNGQWHAISPDGFSHPSGYPCYNGYRISEMGGPEEFTRQLLHCTPEEIASP
ncbi:hypothetical protein [Corynebacterium glaucum]|uniref:hypothetical protein n=1 Tax=Corynebacterium glaucum TaxID=187491 RepID=UPI0025B2BEE7|nr:hypothetical protein [Corynebacterium glaucum]WJZ08257.1 hypothetical protein CGLAUT_08890 [Corynebacterium glaucum]